MSDATDRTEALADLILKVQPTVEPTLTTTAGGEVEKILDRFKMATTFVAGAAVKYGVKIVPTVPNGHIYRVTRAGTLDSTEPSTWPSGAGKTVSSGGATLEEYGEFNGNIYDVGMAARECWRLKMAKASEYSSVSGDNLSVIYGHCQEMMLSFDRPMV